MLGISIDSPWAAAAFAEKLGLDFPMLGDWPKYEASRLYGAYDEERMRDNRQTFIIDRRGTVRALIDDARDFARHSREALEHVQALAKEAPAGGSA